MRRNQKFVALFFGFLPVTDQWVPHTPDFLLSPVGSTSFMRHSLMKAAHAAIE
jgi:hypothetical protein